MRLMWNFCSKRFLILILATIFFYFKMVDQWAWITALGIYVGTETIRKFMP